MNRRNFIKTAGGSAALATWTVTCKYEEAPKKKESNSTCKVLWDYIVYCYEREQGKWIFSENVRGSFAHQREYMTFEEDQGWPYAGWMDQGKLHFMSLKDAQDFVEMHVRAKDDINIEDSIYDIYRKTEDGKREIQVAHYWFNGDTGNQIHWVSDDKTDWSKVECS